MPSSLCAGDLKHLEKICLGNGESHYILNIRQSELRFAILPTLTEEEGFIL